MDTKQWIAVDWGTSRLRVWRMVGHAVQDRAESDQGMGGLTPAAFEPALLALIDPWLPDGERSRVLACGMVGARQGWIEAPYAEVPSVPADPALAVRVPARDPRLDMKILPGLSQLDPPDIMRGEETQIAGFLLAQPEWRGLICLPGTHSKWATVEAGQVTGFRTVLTGELFALLAGQSVLRHSMDDAWHEPAFDAALDEMLADPGGLSGALFSIRAQSLLTTPEVGDAKARLSGLLIGAELAMVQRAQPLDRLAVIGEGRLAGLYGRGLQRLGVEAETMPATTATLNGLCAAMDKWDEGT